MKQKDTLERSFEPAQGNFWKFIVIF